MRILTRGLAVALTGIFLSGCEEVFSGAISAAPIHYTREHMPNTAMTIDGVVYTVKRNQFLREGIPSHEGWAIVGSNGDTFDCRTPTLDGCREALIRGRRVTNQGGGMY